MADSDKDNNVSGDKITIENGNDGGTIVTVGTVINNNSVTVSSANNKKTSSDEIPINKQYISNGIDNNSVNGNKYISIIDIGGASPIGSGDLVNEEKDISIVEVVSSPGSNGGIVNVVSPLSNNFSESDDIEVTSSNTSKNINGDCGEINVTGPPSSVISNCDGLNGDLRNDESLVTDKDCCDGGGIDNDFTLNNGDEDVDSNINRNLREKLKRTRSGSSDYWNQQDELVQDDACIVDFLDKSNNDAEARLAAKRQARAEAREIRMRELERQQKEAEETVDKIYDIYNTSDALNRSSRVAASVASPRSSSVLSGGNNSYHSSRRSSEDSLEEATSIRDVRQELKELEDKFRKAMIANAQLDNEKAGATYQLELYKDRLEELDEQHSQLQRQHREKCRQFEALKRATVKLQEDLEFTRAQLEERDRLIEEQGLVIVGGEYSTSEDENSDNEQISTTTNNKNNNNNNNNNTNSSSSKVNNKRSPKRALVSAQVAGALQQVGEGSLDVRLKKFVEHRNELLDELSRVKLELEEERARNSRGQRNSTLNGPSDDLEDIQREANKLLGDYKFKLQKAEQDVSTLQANVARLESQVVRYKSAAEAAEKVEDDLKVEKRKLQRELREALGRVEELETAHSHLQRRLDKLKNAKSALLKDL